MKPQPNHIDTPAQFLPCKCPLCAKCWRHFTLKTCIYQASEAITPFEGYENV